MNKSPNRPQNIEMPAAGSFAPLDENGEIETSGEFDPVTGSTDHEIWAKCYPGNATPTDPAPGDLIGPPGSVKLTINSETTWSGRVPASACRVAETNLNNNQLVAWQRHTSSTGIEWVRVDTKQFEGEAQQGTFQTQVAATQCLYFAFAPAEFDGPRAESGADGRGAYRPRSLPVPDDCTGVRFTATGEWRHSGNTEHTTNADGRARTEATRNDYVNAAYGSQGLSNSESRPLNQLIGMWSNGWEDGAIFPIGTATDRFEIPAGTKMLYLGMHDGHEWDNNELHLDIDIEWLA